MIHKNEYYMENYQIRNSLSSFMIIFYPQNSLPSCAEGQILSTSASDNALALHSVSASYQFRRCSAVPTPTDTKNVGSVKKLQR